jgi:5-methylcytosine-specific restriction protein A
MMKTCPYCGVVPYDHVCPHRKIRQRYTPKDTDEARFRNTRQWKSKSVEIRERDHYLCQVCLSNHRLEYNNVSVHHIEKAAENEERRLDNYNLITLCEMCHKLADAGKIDKDFLFELARRNEG